ncbi:protporphyrin IX magnesium chelatase [Natrialba chahannaoensis JCM 10990]|uniref:Protporphyrin IX magnesium chelatase n=1 Tax=Natrialba chahannaoensis JCM 10990 TaxID=1227492 RepID=M0B452_9EURY|nr:VWA domain-containing protein [Natrialba chahannaoensis]ELZ05003.1 protporphyrin IX magnesium chelatase [Natrialba chahannaoensis JCM 10990]
MVAESGCKKLSSLPFPAIVGQKELKRVLLAAAVDDDLDGALITGEKGTAKSTTVRALVDLLPEQPTVSDCPYGCAPDEPRLQCEECRNREEPPVELQTPPLVTLPLGATRDRVVGTLSVENAMAGETAFDPGLLARAHRGILYVDEVNLLDDHIVDVILDVAARGVNTVERDGVSVSHPAEFTLIGTMNPEEGDLRPQLRDRFALQATVEGATAIDDRVEIIDRAFDASTENKATNPADEYATDTEALRSTLVDARSRLSSVSIPDDRKAEIAELCLDAGVDGHRGDIATARTARALAALDGRLTVTESDVHEAATFALPHRLRSTPFEEAPELEDLLNEHFDDATAQDDGATDGSEQPDREGDSETGSASESDAESDSDPNENGGSESGEGDHGSSADSGDDSGGDGDGTEQPPESGPETDTKPNANGDRDDAGRTDDPDGNASTPQSTNAAGDTRTDGDEGEQQGGESRPDEESSGDETATPLVPGQRQHAVDVGDAVAPNLNNQATSAEQDAAGDGARGRATPSTANRGARVRTERASTAAGDPIDAAASVRAAANRGRSQVERDDLRTAVREGTTSATIVFVVDASASMRPAMRAAKGVVLELLRESYQRRDEVAFVAFAGKDAEVLLPPTASVELAARHLKELPSGDRTPLAAGLKTGHSVVERAATETAIVVLVTDGKENVAEAPTNAVRTAARRLEQAADDVVVVDAGDDDRVGLASLIAGETGGEHVPLSALTADHVRSVAETATRENS